MLFLPTVAPELASLSLEPSLKYHILIYFFASCLPSSYRVAISHSYILFLLVAILFDQLYLSLVGFLSAFVNFMLFEMKCIFSLFLLSKREKVLHYIFHVRKEPVHFATYMNLVFFFYSIHTN